MSLERVTIGRHRLETLKQLKGLRSLRLENHDPLSDPLDDGEVMIIDDIRDELRQAIPHCRVEAEEQDAWGSGGGGFF